MMMEPRMPVHLGDHAAGLGEWARGIGGDHVDAGQPEPDRGGGDSRYLDQL